MWGGFNTKLRNGLLSQLNEFILAKKHRLVTLDALRIRKIGEIVFQKSNHKILLGPFRGVEIPFTLASSSPSWCAGWILGTFEQQLLKFVTSHHWRFVVNVGAAEGYYPVSLLKKGYAAEAIAFESLEVEQKKMKLFSELNGVDSKLKIMGHAGPNFIHQIDPDRMQAGPSLMIVDIEGSEFDLLDHSTMGMLKNFHLVVEVHNFVVTEKDEIELFVKRLAQYHDIEIVSENSRNIPDRVDVSFLSRRDLMMLIAEERPSDMFWVLATPK